MMPALPNNISTHNDDGRQSHGFATTYGQLKERVAAIQVAVIKAMQQQMQAMVDEKAA